ncbi:MULTISPECIES: VOC family protein [unclassified Lysobacter]|uniref:VOC family protein n=1 Tax=unclassified Lysobacter TaxID=2635362 RepID=UPI001BE6664B|nr:MULTISPECIES: VOC family protein [unclassified Lysobacter]MBT2745640.1 VOC family protein [Lysobacter sp. ISL-42]MBT2753579.1 VOC family protein [Lysobacter sp. ISL-50]MBT2777037.1 VOC family protein [Lysobacter sp. ISL-54]MBT2780337.1 VOC family protein [Lysobacter sp. ISL-52]
MAHRSRLAGFIIDCETGDIDTAADFWSGALGLARVDTYDDEGAQYAELANAAGELHVEVQKVDHPSRVHLDIESDDLDAEAERLEKLGAKRIKFIKRWWVMEAPTGHRFCIVRMKHPELGTPPNVWE